MYSLTPSRSRDKGMSTARPKSPERRVVWGWLMAIAITASAASPAFAQEMKSQIDAARKSLDVSKLPKPEAAKAKLLQAISDFEQYLGGPTNPNGQAWLKFLKWESLKSELGKDVPDLQVLNNIELTFHQNYDGLQYSPFLATRDALDHYVRAVAYGRQPEAMIKRLDSQLERLATVLDSDKPMSELERSRDLGFVLSVLHETNQASAFVSQVQSTYSFPNVSFSASEEFLNRVMSRPVQQGAPVDECILGTHVLGQSCTIGQVTTDLVPNPNGVSLCLQLGASFSSNNIGYNRGVKVYTTGSSPIHASKLITVSPTGVSSAPATASANLQTNINAIEHRLKIVRKIASKQAAKQAPQANAIGEARLERRLAQQFNDQVEEQLAGANARELFNTDRPVLKRLGIPAPTVSLSSTDQHIHGAFREAAPFQLAARAPAKPLAKPADLVAQVHQSLPSNVGELFLGGRTVHSYEMDDLVRQFTGVTEELQKESEGEPWSITFADFHPIEVEFEDGLAKVSIRLTQLTRGEQTLNQSATVSAVYKPLVENGMLVLERQGDVQLLFAGDADRGFRAVTLRTFLKGKFEKFFKEKSEAQSIAIQDRFPDAPPLSLDTLALDDGWLQVGLK